MSRLFYSLLAHNGGICLPLGCARHFRGLWKKSGGIPTIPAIIPQSRDHFVYYAPSQWETVTSSLIGWAHTQNDPCNHTQCHMAIKSHVISRWLSCSLQARLCNSLCYVLSALPHLTPKCWLIFSHNKMASGMATVSMDGMSYRVTMQSYMGQASLPIIATDPDMKMVTQIRRWWPRYEGGDPDIMAVTQLWSWWPRYSISYSTPVRRQWQAKISWVPQKVICKSCSKPFKTQLGLASFKNLMWRLDMKMVTQIRRSLIYMIADRSGRLVVMNSKWWCWNWIRTNSA